MSLNLNDRKRKDGYDDKDACDSCCCCCLGGGCQYKCCYDVSHYCSNCGEKLGMRDSMHECCPCCQTFCNLYSKAFYYFKKLN